MIGADPNGHCVNDAVAGPVDHRHGSCTATVITATTINRIDLVGRPVDLHVFGRIPHADRHGVAGDSIDVRHRPRTLAVDIIATGVGNIDLVSRRVDGRVTAGRGEPNGHRVNDVVAGPVDHRHGPGTHAAGTVAAAIYHVNLVGHRVNLHVFGAIPHVDRNRVIGGAVDDRYRPRTFAVGIVAAFIGHVNLVGRHIDRDGGGIRTHIDGRGVIGVPVDNRYRPKAIAPWIVAALIDHVDLVGRLVNCDRIGVISHVDSGGGIGGPIDHRHRTRVGARAEDAAEAIGHVNLVGNRVDGYGVRASPRR